jgi:hypothetical protein
MSHAGGRVDADEGHDPSAGERPLMFSLTVGQGIEQVSSVGEQFFELLFSEKLPQIAFGPVAAVGSVAAVGPVAAVGSVAAVGPVANGLPSDPFQHR